MDACTHRTDSEFSCCIFYSLVVWSSKECWDCTTTPDKLSFIEITYQICHLKFQLVFLQLLTRKIPRETKIVGILAVRSLVQGKFVANVR